MNELIIVLCKIPCLFLLSGLNVLVYVFKTLYFIMLKLGDGCTNPAFDIKKEWVSDL